MKYSQKSFFICSKVSVALVSMMVVHWLFLLLFVCKFFKHTRILDRFSDEIDAVDAISVALGSPRRFLAQENCKFLSVFVVFD